MTIFISSAYEEAVLLFWRKAWEGSGLWHVCLSPFNINENSLWEVRRNSCVRKACLMSRGEEKGMQSVLSWNGKCSSEESTPISMYHAKHGIVLSCMYVCSAHIQKEKKKKAYNSEELSLVHYSVTNRRKPGIYKYVSVEGSTLFWKLFTILTQQHSALCLSSWKTTKEKENSLNIWAQAFSLWLSTCSFFFSAMYVYLIIHLMEEGRKMLCCAYGGWTEEGEEGCSMGRRRKTNHSLSLSVVCVTLSRALIMWTKTQRQEILTDQMASWHISHSNRGRLFNKAQWKERKGCAVSQWKENWWSHILCLLHLSLHANILFLSVCMCLLRKEEELSLFTSCVPINRRKIAPNSHTFL